MTPQLKVLIDLNSIKVNENGGQPVARTSEWIGYGDVLVLGKTMAQFGINVPTQNLSSLFVANIEWYTKGSADCIQRLNDRSKPVTFKENDIVRFSNFRPYTPGDTPPSKFHFERQVQFLHRLGSFDPLVYPKYEYEYLPLNFKCPYCSTKAPWIPIDDDDIYDDDGAPVKIICSSCDESIDLNQYHIVYETIDEAIDRMHKIISPKSDK